MARAKILGQNHVLLRECEGDVKELLSKLTEKQYRFYLNLTKDSFEYSRDLVKSFLDAGYESTPNDRQKAKDLYNSPKIKVVFNIHLEKLKKKQEKENVTIFEHTDRDLLFIISAAKSQFPIDLPTMRAAVMDRAKLHGLLAERQIITTDNQYSLDNNIKQAAIARAEQRLLSQADTAITADFAVIDQPGSIEMGDQGGAGIIGAGEFIAAEEEEEEENNSEDFLME